MKKTERIKDRLSNIAALIGGLWIMLAIPLHIVMFLWLVRLKFKNWLTILIILVVWWAITLAAYGISKAIEKRKKEEKAAQEKEYREKYITPMPVKDDMLGTLPFEKDSCENNVKLQIEDFTLFDGKEDVMLNVEVPENMVDTAVQTLRYIYGFQEKLMAEVYEYTVQCMSDYGEVDEENNPCGLEFARKNMWFFSVDLSEYNGEICANMAGSLHNEGSDMLGDHWIVMDVHYPSKKTDCYLEG